MSKKLYEEASVQAIADAIRDKCNTTDTMTIAEMPDKITSMSSGGSCDLLPPGVYLPASWKTDLDHCEEIVGIYDDYGEGGYETYIYKRGYFGTGTNANSFVVHTEDNSYSQTITFYSGTNNSNTQMNITQSQMPSSRILRLIFDSISVPTTSLEVYVTQKSYYTPTPMETSSFRTYAGYSYSDDFYILYPPALLVVSSRRNIYSEIRTYSPRCVIIPQHNTPNAVSEIASIRGITFYVKDSAVNAFKTATNWATVADNIFPLSQCPYFEN